MKKLLILIQNRWYVSIVNVVKRYNPDYIAAYRRSGRVASGFWGWMSLYGVGELVEIDARLNSVGYLEILENVAIPTIEKQFGSVRNIVFMQDYSGVHTAKTVRAFLNENMNVIKWPANSPDLNPIENVWAEIVRNWPYIKNRTRANLKHIVFQRWELLRNRLGKFPFNSLILFYNT